MSTEDEDSAWETETESQISEHSSKYPKLEETAAYNGFPDENKGTIALISEASAPCSMEFLQQILVDLKLAQFESILARGNSKSKALHNVLDNIAKEITRLEKHSELFPSNSIQEQFCGLVHEMYTLLERTYAVIDVSDECQFTTIYENMLEYKYKKYWPSFDEERKPWQQFLHNKAPGSGIDGSYFQNEGSTQVVPLAGAKIRYVWQSEYMEIIRTLEEEGNAPKPLRQEKTRSVNNAFPEHTIQPMVIRPGPFASRPMAFPRGDRFATLEELSQDFAAMEGRSGDTSDYDLHCLFVHDTPTIT